ncbi:MAG TPA: DUF4292 domain-containing protein [candidate division Zixibacteria bacterium]|nr:DUF4292 domain-containing protein [candidate division Zixibacteria bacterium]
MSLFPRAARAAGGPQGRDGPERARRSHRSTVLSLVVALVVLPACAAIVAPPAPERPSRQWEAADILESLARREREFRSLKALASVRYAGPDGKKGFQEAVVVERPERLRLETLSFLGTILIVTANAQEITGYHIREGAFVRGRPTKENLLRLAEIPLELREMTALLLGLPPVALDGRWRQDGNALVFAGADGGGDVVRFESAEAVPTGWERTGSGGTVELSATFADYTPTRAGLFPTRIDIESPGRGQRLEIRYQGPELNLPLAPELFTQQKPEHATEFPIEAVGR